MANWSALDSWFTLEWSGSVQQDATVTYQVEDFTSDATTPYWTIRLDGTYNSWFPREVTIATLDTVTQDSAIQSYDILYSVYSTTVSPTWNVESNVASINSEVILPFASAQADASATYQVFYVSPAIADKTVQYRITTLVENVITASYNIVMPVTADVELSYGVGGYVIEDAIIEYSVVSEVIQDSPNLSYRITGGVTNDSSTVSYNISTSPLTAGDNRQVTYSVLSSVQTDAVSLYNVLTQAEKDSTGSYRVLSSAQHDTSALYDISGGIARDAVVTYQLIGVVPVTSNFQFSYSIVAQTVRVPNVIGYPLPKAKKVLEQNNLVLGQVTYT